MRAIFVCLRAASFHWFVAIASMYIPLLRWQSSTITFFQVSSFEGFTRSSERSIRHKDYSRLVATCLRQTLQIFTNTSSFSFFSNSNRLFNIVAMSIPKNDKNWLTKNEKFQFAYIVKSLQLKVKRIWRVWASKSVYGLDRRQLYTWCASLVGNESPRWPGDTFLHSRGCWLHDPEDRAGKSFL